MDLFERIFESTPDALLVVGADGRIAHANAQAEAMFGYPKAALAAMGIEELIPHRLRPLHATLRTAYAATPRNRPMDTGSEFGALRADGSEFAADIMLSPMGDAADGVVLCAIRDVTERQRQEVVRQANHLTHATISASVADGVIATDTEGVVTFCNPAAVRLTGWPERQAVGRVLQTVVSLEDEATGAPVDVASLLRGAGDDVAHNALMRGRGTQVTPVELAATPVVGPDGRRSGTVFTIRDLRFARRAQRALRESEARFRSAFDSAGAGMALKSEDGTIIRVNASLCAMLGRSSGDLVGVEIDTLRHPDDVAFARAEIAALVDGDRTALHLETRLRHADGSYRWTTETVSVLRGNDGGVQYLLAQVHDNDQRKRMMAELMAINARYERYEAALSSLSREHAASGADPLAALERVTEVVAGALDADRVCVWRLVDEDRAMETDDFYDRRTRHHESGERFAASAHPVLFEDMVFAAPVTTWHAGLDNPRLDSLVTGYFTPRQISAFMCVQVHLDGRQIGAIACSRRGEPRPWAPDEQSFFVAASHLVAARYAQAAQQRAAARLREADKMAAIGRLAGGIAHDFNNVLMVVQGCADILRKQVVPAQPDAGELIAAIRESAGRAASLTRQLLLFSRNTPKSARVIQLGHLVNELTAMLRRVIGDNIALTTQVAPDIHNVRIDPHELEQVLMNLIVNARDAMPNGGDVTVRVRNVSGHDVAAAPAEGRFVQIAVRDTGGGIAPELISRIFEPFFTTKDVGKGTGLGLATAYAIVEKAGGVITVESELGAGTTFLISLPAATEPAEVRVSGSIDVDMNGSGTILVVEDEDAVRRVTVAMLEQRGYEVVPARTANEALATLHAGTQQVDLVLTDVIMPGMNGGELAAQVRERWPDLPIVFMSGYHDAAMLEGAIGASPVDVLHKPFTGAALSEAVRRALPAATVTGNATLTAARHES